MLLFQQTLKLSETKEIFCESVSNYDNWIPFTDVAGNLRTCWIPSVSINAPGDVFSSDYDESIEALSYEGNKKVFYLPNKVGEKFPLLLSYYAMCSVKEIFRENFIGLNQLQGLRLDDNQIEKISSDTFKDLTSLRMVKLSKQK